MVVSKIFYFHPYLGKISILTSIFFRWVGSTTNQYIIYHTYKIHIWHFCWKFFVSYGNRYFCWLAHTCLCAVTITNVSRHLCEEVTSLEVGWILSLELSCMLLSLARGSFWYKCPLCTFDCENFSPHPPHLHLIHASFILHVLI